jgi:hypothetical protein
VLEAEEKKTGLPESSSLLLIQSTRQVDEAAVADPSAFGPPTMKRWSVAEPPPIVHTMEAAGRKKKKKKLELLQPADTTSRTTTDPQTAITYQLVRPPAASKTNQISL